MNRRIETIQKALNEKNIDAALFMNPKNMYYLTGFTGSAAYLFVSRKDVHILTDCRYTEQAKQECPWAIHHEYSATMPHFAIVQALGYTTIGFEAGYLSYAMATGLQRMMSFAQWLPFNGVIEKMRAVKDEEEIVLIKIAAEISDKSFCETLDYIKPGITEKQVGTFLFNRMVENGGDHHLSFDIIVGSGRRSSSSHCIATEKKIENGDFVVIDFGCRYKYYTTDTTRTLVIGKASDRQREVYNHVYAAQAKALSEMKAGMTNAEAHRITNAYFEKAGYGNLCGNTLGHGIGLDVEDGPILIDCVPYFGEVALKENMIVTVEPGIYIPDFGGVRIEDDVIIKQNGVEVITKASKELIEII